MPPTLTSEQEEQIRQAVEWAKAMPKESAEEFARQIDAVVEEMGGDLYGAPPGPTMG